ncbi:hypothetical protein B0T24DRAFT_95836 [Lasiosphaeria ovina]|uniref:Uncharacterized protein n=1 Tax=Lasiosphaeria ovina TaxID=92902 RepID=A0AAE0JTY9_9PEZI|nr:hypothetical protein B0T24DRAFT_95836 [Lasiosphaeria ovina]
MSQQPAPDVICWLAPAVFTWPDPATSLVWLSSIGPPMHPSSLGKPPPMPRFPRLCHLGPVAYLSAQSTHCYPTGCRVLAVYSAYNNPSVWVHGDKPCLELLCGGVVCGCPIRVWLAMLPRYPWLAKLICIRLSLIFLLVMLLLACIVLPGHAAPFLDMLAWQACCNLQVASHRQMQALKVRLYSFVVVVNLYPEWS